MEGKVDRILERNGQLILITFSNCTAEDDGDRVLFDPAWEVYDMAVGDRITSVFNGPADKDAYLGVALVPKGAHDQSAIGPEAKEAGEPLCAGAQDPREQDRLRSLGRDLETQQAEHPEDWLLSMEIS